MGVGAGTRSTAVIGGGASGVLVAAHLARSNRSPQRITIFEPRQNLGAGAAYSTSDPRHLLNTPARSMSAFENQPDDFVEWLSARSVGATPDSYAPRRLYRRYLRDVLDMAVRCAARGTTVEWARTSVESIRPVTEPAGRRCILRTGSAQERRFDSVVLAVGAPEPAALSSLNLPASPRVVTNPWAPGALDQVPADSDVLLIGTGLTAVDVALGLADGIGIRTVHARSRKGLLPAVHTSGGFAEFSGIDFEGVTTARSAVRAFRDAVGDATEAGLDWRNVVSSARSRFPEVWRAMPGSEQQRLLRHAGRRWEVRRHRMSPLVASYVSAMQASGALTLGAGHTESVECYKSDGREVFHVTLASGARRELLKVGSIVDCSGPGTYLQSSSKLTGRLLDDGIVQQHRSGMGISVTEDGVVVTKNAKAEDLLYAIGWCRRGGSFESTAVPELRKQAAQIARHMSESGRERIGVVKDARVAPVESVAS
jgi:uncharacterized NAD(P)/FAD-binding protein YdhS